ncbi:cell elongation-specific peptidoglycan biosynthesis regulator RodA [Geothermobacter ehrlichii]|uniref:Peptidoglycan glycosyltransferase RodA n=1 Tax=Geothermobacter ehrlichii TaxID=213224 RepID=A0A5D3WKP0_9BACT|nr:rod shape-determining protein RodA [Geothermobacter ehrlichii]TYO98680.1 cell elongation-specific peptidoglycan biosynthesis regulator RodA [Geothermobacter ehrlichii]
MFDRRLLTHFDWLLLILVLLIAAIGIGNLYSATSAWEARVGGVYLRQIAWLGFGVTLALALCLFDYRRLIHLSFFFYAANILLLVAVFVIGKTIMGATRWIDLGFFNLQPSEVMKLVIIMALARYFSENAPYGGFSLKELGGPFLLLGIPVLLVARQPDLGTALLILFIGLSMALVAGIRRQTLLFLTLSGMLGCWGGWYLLHDYQRQRIMTFLDPEHDPLGAGYHIIQSKIAVGSGEFFGKGFMQGTQSRLSFLPERHTDFAFSVFAEEWGFTGCLLLIGLYLLLVLWGLYIARRAADRFGSYLAVGVTAMLFWHIVVNLGMVIGLLPVVGVPLPLFSYGGTSMVTTMVGVGMLLNVSMRRFVF